MPKTTCFCDKCKKVVKVKEVHYAGLNCNVYLKCGHHIHYTFRERKTEPECLVLGERAIGDQERHA